MTLYTQVPVTERLPAKTGETYFTITDKGNMSLSTFDEWGFSSHIVSWLEPITFPTDGELITYIIQNALKGLNREQLQAVTRALVERSGLVPTDYEISVESQDYFSFETHQAFQYGAEWILDKLKP